MSDLVSASQFNGFIEEMRAFRRETYDILKDIGADLHEFKSETHDNFKELRSDLDTLKKETHDNFQDVRADNRLLRKDLSQEKRKIDELYRHRDRLTIKFSRSFGIVTICLSVLSSGFMFGLFLVIVF